uniref:Protein sickie n=1 Tax=Syphacia muris TaxID=451379 RepID=A0A0N5AQ17_9BILA
MYRISDPLIKVIPPYRHRDQSSSCSSTTSGGGGQQFSPHFTSSFNGNLSSSDGFNSRCSYITLTSRWCLFRIFFQQQVPLNSSPISNTLFGTNQVNSTSILSTVTTQRPATSVVPAADRSGLRDGGNMLVDPIRRAPLPQTSVDRAMISAMMSQPIGQTLLERTSSPMSSGRSSAAQDSSPSTAQNVPSMKLDQSSNAELHVSSASIVPLPSNIAAIVNSNSQKDDLKPLITDVALNNENVSVLSSNQSAISPVYTTIDGKAIPAMQRAVKRARTNQLGEKSKKPRSNIRANKSMKTLLESVGPLVSETVTDFQRERVNERDAAAAVAASTTSNNETPSTSGENNASLYVRSPEDSQAGCYSSFAANAKASPGEPTAQANGICLPSTSTAGTADVTKLCGVPLLRACPKGLSSPETTQANSYVDRHHVSTSAPSTSLGLSGNLGGIQPGPLPQTLEELLERQWEQGSHFMMAHAPFDVAQLLSCLHELKKENVRLEGELNGLVRRRDHLLAVNAQLSLGLSQNSAPPTNSPGNSPHMNGSASVAGTTSGPSISGSQLQVSAVTQQSGGTMPSPGNVASLPVASNPLQQSGSSGVAVAMVTAQTSRSVVSGPSPAVQPLPTNTNYVQPLDDSLNKLRNLTASSGLQLPVPGRSASTTSAPQLQPTGPAGSVVLGRPASRPTPSGGQSTSIAAGIQQSPLAGYSQNRMSSTASANSVAPYVSTPSSLSNSYTATAPKSSVVGGSNDIATAASSTTTPAGPAAGISPDRQQQQLAAAAVALGNQLNAALGNHLNSNFLASRTLNTTPTAAANNPLGQFAPQDLIAQFALHHLLQQQAALRYGGIVIPGSSTPPTSTNSNNQPPTGHPGK